MPDSTAAPDDLATRPADCGDLLRDWLRNATERFGGFKRVTSSREIAKATKQFARPSGSGRARGRIALERAFRECASLEARGDEGRLPYLIWSLIRPRPETESVSVNLADTIRFEDGRVFIVGMIWTIDAAEAALAHALRHGERDLDALLLAAHRALLDAPARVAEAKTELAVPAGGGWFVGRFGQAQAGSERYIFFQAQRWLPGPPEDEEPIGRAGDGKPTWRAGGWIRPVWRPRSSAPETRTQ